MKLGLLSNSVMVAFFFLTLNGCTQSPESGQSPGLEGGELTSDVGNDFDEDLSGDGEIGSPDDVKVIIAEKRAADPAPVSAGHLVGETQDQLVIYIKETDINPDTLGGYIVGQTDLLMEKVPGQERTYQIFYKPKGGEDIILTAQSLDEESIGLRKNSIKSSGAMAINQLPLTGSMSGVVSLNWADESTSDPNKEATVFIPGTLYKTTIKDGEEFLIPDIPAGEHTFTVSADGFLDHSHVRTIEPQTEDSLVFIMTPVTK